MKSNILLTISDAFSYSNWANERLINNINQVQQNDYFKILPVPFKNLHGLLHHLYYYDAKYYFELTTNTIHLTKKSDELSKEKLFENILGSSKNWKIWLDSIVNLENIEKHLPAIFDLLAHNNYHRGQANTLMSILGYKPQSLDIYLYRTSHMALG